jgi:sugar phosphate isomerase/epimerase
MTSPRVLPSTTSHKHEPLVATLEIFAHLGMLDLDLNLNHMIERSVEVESVKAALHAGHQRVWIVSGGWCDFYHDAPQVEETFRSVDRQVAIAVELGVHRMRLFFGRLKREDYSAHALATIAGNIRRLGDRYPEMQFVFENHDGASSHPEICREILDAVSRPNIRLNFDPINFEHEGIDSMDALRELLPLIGHVHLKGLERDGFCEFGAGDVDLLPVLQSLLAGGYRGDFTVEYEGTFDRTLRLYQSTQRAHAVLNDLWNAIPAEQRR